MSSFFHKSLSFLLLSLTLSFSSFGQPGAKWFFGNYAGLDFSTNPPTVLNNGKLSTHEGCSSISNNLGQLLFYTDGTTVYDGNHNIMPNGSGLMGNSSSVQSSVVSPKPGTFNTALQRYDAYYIVTCDAANPGLGGNGNGIRYTEVDMTLNGGLGGVNPSLKNIFLHGDATTESISVAKHANGCDFWIIIHEVNSSSFRIHQVDANGVNMTPVISAIGPIIEGWTGSMKASPNSKMICLCSQVNGTGGLHLFSFDNATGIVSQLIFSDNNRFYSAEFSPNSSVLYGAPSTHEIFQYNLNPASGPVYLASKTLVGNSADELGTLQTAPNGKIYAARYGATWLGVINNPNTLGTGCAYVDQGQNFAGTNINGNAMVGRWGLPSFVSSFAAPMNEIVIDSTKHCDSMNYCFSLLDQPYSNSTTSWEIFNDLNSSLVYGITAPDFCYDLGVGTYTIRATIQTFCANDTVEHQVNVTFSPQTPVILGNLSGCPSVTLDAGVFSSYLWSNGATTQTAQFSPGDNPVTVTVTNAAGCTYTSAPVNVTDTLISNETIEIAQGDSILIHGEFQDSAGIYSGSFVSVDGCDSISNVTLVLFVPEFHCSSVFVPTIFSPNGDGQNDYICVMGGCINQMVFAIYDRWGEKVFESNNTHDCWDGTFKGRESQSGAYVYKLKAKMDDGTNVKESGNITIVR